MIVFFQVLEPSAIPFADRLPKLVQSPEISIGLSYLLSSAKVTPIPSIKSIGPEISYNGDRESTIEVVHCRVSTVTWTREPAERDKPVWSMGCLPELGRESTVGWYPNSKLPVLPYDEIRPDS